MYTTADFFSKDDGTKTICFGGIPVQNSMYLPFMGKKNNNKKLELTLIKKIKRINDRIVK